MSRIRDKNTLSNFGKKHKNEGVRGDGPKALFTYVGSEETPVEKIVETVDELYKKCDEGVAQHITNLTALATSLNGFSVDILLALSKMILAIYRFSVP